METEQRPATVIDMIAPSRARPTKLHFPGVSGHAIAVATAKLSGPFAMKFGSQVVYIPRRGCAKGFGERINQNIFSGPVMTVTFGQDFRRIQDFSRVTLVSTINDTWLENEK